MTIYLRNSIICFLLLLVSCNPKKDYKATKTCKNLKFHAHTIYPNENVTIRFNKEVILNETVKNKQEGYYFDKDFCLPKVRDCLINVSTSFGSKKYIDTTILVNDLSKNYHLVISMPHPVNWKEYYKDSFPPKNWGYLPIDSCIRFVKLIPDSLYNNTIEM